MGANTRDVWPYATDEFSPGSIGERWSLEDKVRVAQETAEENARLRRIAADAESTRFLAEMECPADLIEWGRNHGIPTFAEFTWQAGFMAGWRAAMSRKPKP